MNAPVPGGTVLYEARGAVALLTLNRPDALNSFTRQMHRDLWAALDRAEADPAIRALVPGATLDDAVAAVIGGALRRYLDDNGELPPTHSLAAIVPEAAPDGPAPQQLRWRHVRLGTDIADARQRLTTLAAQAKDAPDEVARLLGSPALAGPVAARLFTVLAWSTLLIGVMNPSSRVTASSSAL